MLCDCDAEAPAGKKGLRACAAALSEVRTRSTGVLGLIDEPGRVVSSVLDGGRSNPLVVTGLAGD